MVPNLKRRKQWVWRGSYKCKITELTSHEFSQITWCSVTKQWGVRRYFTEVMSEQYPKGRLILLIPMTADQYESCNGCGKVATTSYLKFSPINDLKYCNNCLPLVSSKKPTSIDRIHIYHSTDWNFIIQRLPGIKDKTNLPMGLEIEMMINNANQSQWGTIDKEEERDRVTKHLLKNNQNNFYFETDGSLRSHVSFECITNPMTLGYHKQFWNVQLPRFREVAVAWNIHKFYATNPYKYGIHITTHEKYWSTHQLKRLIEFFAFLHNAEFLHAIAQRTDLYSRTGFDPYKLGSFDKPIWRTHATYNKTLKKLNAVDRYQPINFKKCFVEFRMFASTLNQQSFLKNLEFIESLWIWTKETNKNIDFEKYLQWVLTNKERIIRYSNLIQFLSASSFACKGRRIFKNPWRSLVIQHLQEAHLKVCEPLNNYTEGLIHVPDNPDAEAKAD